MHWWSTLVPANHIALSLSRVRLFAAPWNVASQALQPMEFSRQEYGRGGLPFPSPGELPHPGVEPTSLVSPALAGRFFTTVSLGKTLTLFNPLIHIIL